MNMSMKGNTARQLFGIAMLAAGLSLFTGCPRDIGLGGAVDTQKPVVSILTPKADSVVRQTINISGTASDDRELDRITVTFVDNDSSSGYAREFPAVINNATKTWSLSLDTENGEIPDASYEILVTAYDKSGKTQSATRSLQVDNTAPTVLVTSPTLYGTNKSEFCRQIIIQGEAYDASPIQEVMVSICSKDGNELVDPVKADGTNTWSALFTYATLQNHLQEGGNYYFYIKAKDKSGNVNSTMYHVADLWEKLGQINPTGTELSLPSMNQIGKLDQGVMNEGPFNLTTSVLHDIRIPVGGAAAKMAFITGSDYPDLKYTEISSANIEWTNLGTDDVQTLPKINKGSAIFATIQPPSDLSAILPDTVFAEISRIKADGSTKEWTDQQSDIIVKVVGSSVNVTINPRHIIDEVPDELIAGRYRITLSCRTNSGSAVGDSIDFQVSSDAPIVRETTISTLAGLAMADTNASYAQGMIKEDLDIWGTILDNTENIIDNPSHDTLEITCKKPDGSSVTYSVNNGITLIKDGVDYTGDWKLPFSIPKDEDDNPVDGTYTFTLKGKTGGAPTTITRVLVVDTTQPTLTLVSPVNGGYYTTTNLMFQGSASDIGSGIAGTWWYMTDDLSKIFADGESIESTLNNASTLTGDAQLNTWYRFDTSTLLNQNPTFSSSFQEKQYKIFTITRDAIGWYSPINVAQVTIDNNDPELREYVVRASGLTTKSDFQLAGTAWDTDGIKTITVTDGTHTWSSDDENPAVTFEPMTSDPCDGSEPEEDDYNWRINFKVGAANSAKPTYIADGTSSFTITVTDLAGKQRSYNRSVTVDTTLPAIESGSFANPLVKKDDSVFNRLTVTASDDGSGLASVYYQITQNGTTAPAFTTATENDWTPLGLGSAGWTGNVDFTDKPEGTNYAWLAAKDNVGNIFVKSSPVETTVDLQVPVITVSGATDTGPVDVELTINIDDTNPTTPTVEVKKGGTSLGTLAVTAAGTGTWKVTVPFSSSDSYSDDGSYRVYVNETDTRGRQALQVEYEIKKDQTVPNVNTIDAPESGKTGINALYGSSYIFRGTAKDAAGGSGLARILYAFTATAAAPASGTAADLENNWTAQTVPDGSWTFTREIDSGTTAASGRLCEGKWYLHVMAEDKAGNRTTAVSREFDIDLANPVLEVTTPASTTKATYAKDSVTIGGTVSDTYGIPSSGVSVTVGSFNTNAIVSGSSWTVTLSKEDFASSLNTQLNVSITAKDKAGKTAEKIVPIFFDTTGPSLEITAPAEGQSTDQREYLIRGTVADSGSGIEAVYYTTDGSTPAATSDTVTISGTSWEKRVTLDSAEGEKVLKLLAVDKLGNETTKETHFYLDNEDPQLTETGITQNGATKNTAFTFTGKVWDTNGVASLTVTDGTTTWTSEGTGAKVSLTKVKASPGTDNWSLTLTPGTDVTDGISVFTIKVTDVAGKETTLTRTVTVDATVPEISGKSFASDDVYLDVSVFNRLTVTASDSGTGLSGVFYQEGTAGAAPDFTSETGWTSLALGSEGWTANIDFTKDKAGADRTDSTAYIYVAAKDVVGNRVVDPVPVAVTVDLKKPVVVIDGPSSTGRTNIDLTITVNDTNPTTPTVKVKKGGTSLGSLTAASAGSGVWKVTVPFESDAYSDDGRYLVYVNETDANGRAAAQTEFAIEKDTTAPATNTIDAPESGKTGQYALYGSSYLFRGTAKDAADGSGLKRILYAFTSTASVPASGSDDDLAANWTELTMPDGTWTVTREINTGTTVTEDHLCEGKWFLHVLAEDNAGNRSAATTREFDIDMADPTLTVTEPAVITSTKYVKDTLTITGTTSDSNGVKKLTLTVDEDDPVTITPDADGNWTVTLEKEDYSINLLHSAVIKVMDNVGKTAEKTIPFCFDTTGPSLSISLPASGEAVETNVYSISGTLADTGIGVDPDLVTYVITKGTTTVASGNLTVNGASWSASSISLGTEQGTLKLVIDAKDKLGNENYIERTFSFDSDAPVIDEDEITVTGRTTKEGFILKGTASDTNALYGDGTGAITITTPASVSRTVNVDTEGNWTETFAPGTGVGQLADGTHVFTITVRDKANRETAIQRTVVVDTVAPVITKTGTNESFVTSTATAGWFKDPSLAVSATVTDERANAVETVECAVSQSSSTAWQTDTELEWRSLTKRNNVFTGTAAVLDGTDYVCIRAKDTAGNYAYSTQETVKVDTVAPSVLSAYKEAACTTVVSTALTNAEEDLVLYAKTEDNGSGVTAVQVVKINETTLTGSNIIDAEPAGTNVYKITIPASVLQSAYDGTDKTVPVYVKAADAAGNVSPVTNLFTLRFDKTAPEIDFTSPADGSTVNKTINVTGKTTEAQGLESVELFINGVSKQTFSGNAMYSWSYSLDTTAYPPAAGQTTSSVVLKVVAKDEAGNSKTVEHTVTVNQSADRPVIKLTNIAFEGMSEATPKWITGTDTILGNVLDDDGINNGTESLWISTDDGANWSQVSVDNGAFSKQFTEDNTYAIKFKVKDVAGGEFISSATAALTRPVLKGSDDVATDDAILHLIIDTKFPEADLPEFSFTGADNSWNSDLLRGKTFGKDAEYSTFIVRQYAYDANSIQKVEVSVDSGSYTAASLMKDADNKPVTKTVGEKKYEAYSYTFTSEAIGALSSGTHTLNIKVTDRAGKEKETNVTFSVDNTAPTVAVTSHADGDKVDGSFYLAGTTRDEPAGNGAASLAYKITSSATLSPSEDWTEIATDIEQYGAHKVAGTLSTWRIYFDDDVNNKTDYTHDRLLKKILVTIPEYNYLKIATEGDYIGSVVYKDNSQTGHAAGTLYNDLTTLYIHFKATDAYNNTSYSVCSLKLDPQGDIPTVSISYPQVTAYGWKNSSGTTVVYTKEQLPVSGSKVYDTLDHMTDKAYVPDTVSDVNRIAHSITVDGVTYTNYGGETVQGGIVRIQGTADDEKAIEAVYIQIDPTYSVADGFQWTEGSAGNALLPNGAALSSKYTVETITTGLTGIKAGISGAWSISLNESGEFNGENGQKNYVGIRAFAKDVDGNVSPLNETDTIVLTIDSDTPRIGTSEELYLYQYDAAGNVTASMKYEDGMWLKGLWWLEGSVEDSNGITRITVDGNMLVNIVDKNDSSKNTVSDDVRYETWNANTSYTTTGYHFKYQIGSEEENKFGALDYTIYAIDGDTNAKTVTKIITINYDNAAPVLAASDSVNYNISPTVVQSNGFYTLGSAVSEASEGTNSQSGFERLALYFVRPGKTAGTGTLYDTYYLKNETANKLTLSSLRNEDGLYWKTVTVTRNASNLKEITIPSTATANIHKGGLVKIGGAMYIIKEMSGTTLTLSGSPAILNNDDTKPEYLTEEAKFAIAQIVDHTVTESNGINPGTNGYYTDVVNDDGDGMVESVSTQGGTSFWQANINSRNIPDGAIEIHYVAFDKAGNYSAGVVTDGRVANNAPRLAGVKYETDINGDGDITGSELKRKPFAIASDTGKYRNSDLKTSYVLGTKTTNDQTGAITCSDPVLTVKGAISVVPEIVGGNGKLSYTYSVAKSGATVPYYTSSLIDSGKNGTDYSGTGAALEINDDIRINLGMKELLSMAATVDGDNQLFKFVIWDETEGLTAGSTSQNAVLEMVMNVKLSDTTPPKPFIKPFYWTNKTNNSVYRTTDANENTVMQGHIDLAADLLEATFNQTSGEMDKDDKVSGAIVIEGTATDDTLLSGLYVKVFTGTNTNQFSFQGVTAINAAKLVEMGYTEEQAAASPLLGYYPVATYNGSWTGSGNYATNGWKFEIVGNDVFSDEGHTTHWKLTLNTEKLSVPVINDLKVRIIATDKGEPKLSDAGGITYTPNTSDAGPAKTSAESMTDFNQFDVVPYITSISTSLDNAYKSNTSVFNRSANGWYPVRRGEDIIIKGWNLKNGDTAPTVTLGSKELTVGTSSINEVKATITNGSDAKSGELSITANSIASLNNKHNNALTYNLEKNGINNDTLTDARKLYVWSFTTIKENNSVRYPSFAVGKDSNQTIGFIYDNGGKTVAIYRNDGSNTRDKTLDSSYTQWYDTSVAVDSNGHIFGTAMNGDATSSEYANFKIYGFAETKDGTSYTSTAGAYSSGGNNSMLENAYDNKTFNANRIINPKTATRATSTTKTDVYQVYYDNIRSAFVFREGTVENGFFGITFGGGLKSHSSNKGGTAKNAQIIAGTGAGTGNTTKGDGEYIAVGVVPTDATDAGTAVVAWASGSSLYFSYNKNPGTVDNTTWAKNTVCIDSDYAGWYVDMDVDAAGGIHIAYYGSSAGDLRYAYIPAYNQASAAEIVTVDSYLSVGTNIDIVATSEKVGGRYIPYISYYMSAMTKTSFSNRVAWPTALVNGKFANGAINDKYTGNWEVMTIPTSETPLDYSVGVGVKKNDSSTNKPILGYGTKNGLETAQLQ